ncbi:MAG: hypothetical protein E7C36_05280 [Mixta calida]|uniref:hypothetical protein n=1 Tax=Mixta calida TaxID=665913 RepID=UPI00289CFFFA|nr:hypothetical protein [Mixta calida]MDU3817385.1 hypothetical protein [Pantoea sp.]MDU2732701.1 hypothetical protein [Mixta calida]MDU5768421.1 hypothetical protein [Mixta calida]MDU5829182.1 hypothetical protein [Mixta calida]MDU6537074.1 hypothetical protein [Mixta calida]
MKSFIFFYSNDSYKIIEASNIKQEEIDKLVQQGFTRTDIQADNKKTAIEIANKITGINTKELQEFGKDVTFSAIIESILR